MTSFLRCAAMIGTIAFLSPVHEQGQALPAMPGPAALETALHTFETAKAASQAIAALDPDTRTRLLAHMAATAGAGEPVAVARRAAKP
jgi:hypothetical protein